MDVNGKDMPDAQHAYIKGKSTALHTLISHIEKALHYKEYALVAFFDINRAFNNFKPQSAIEAMKKLKIYPTIIYLISKLISSRLIISTLRISSIDNGVTPQ